MSDHTGAPEPYRRSRLQRRFRFYYRLPIFTAVTTCPRTNCDVTLDQYSYHHLYCRQDPRLGGTICIGRHDGKTRRHFPELRNAVHQPIAEPRSNLQQPQNSRPDIMDNRNSEGTYYLDVIVVHPLTDPRVRSVKRRFPKNPIWRLQSDIFQIKNTIYIPVKVQLHGSTSAALL